jgi:hypothetical protein
LKTVFDILPKVKQIGKFVISTIRGKRSKAASRKSRRNADTGLLSQQLLAAVRDEADELAGGDHADLATREMQQRGQLTEADAELPELEDDALDSGFETPTDLEDEFGDDGETFVEVQEPALARLVIARRRTGPGLNPLEPNDADFLPSQDRSGNQLPTETVLSLRSGESEPPLHLPLPVSLTIGSSPAWKPDAPELPPDEIDML